MSLQQKILQTILQFTPPKEPDELIGEKNIVGKPIDRVDGKLKVTGKAIFAAEYQFENLAYAALVYSSIPKGRITRMDLAAAIEAPGVVKVLTHENAPKLNAPPKFSGDAGNSSGSSMDGLPILHDDKIHWNGQPVAVVLAETQDQAEYAASLIRIAYEHADANLSFEKSIPAAKTPPVVMGQEPEIKIGDAEKALSKAKVVVDQTYETPRYNHNAIEPHATTVAWTEDGLLVCDATQNVYGVRNTLAGYLGVKPETITVTSPFVGGGFGGKGSLWQNVAICALAAKVCERPVRLAVSREGVFRIVGGRTPSQQRVALGVDENNKLVSLIHTGTTATTESAAFPEQFSFPARVLYEAENFLIGQKAVNLDTVANTFMRAPGESIGTYALECAIDELAYKANIDPIELRRLNEPLKDPIKKIPFSSRHRLEAFDRGAKQFGWKRHVPRSQKQGKWLVGQGVASAYYPYYRFQGSAAVRLEKDGQVHVKCAGHEMGMGVATVQLQHSAERLAMPIDKISFEYGNTNLPESPQAGGSNQTASMSASITKAIEELHKTLLRYAHQHKNGPFEGIFVDGVEAFNGGLRVKDNPAKFMTYQQMLSLGEKDFVEVTGKSDPPMEMLKYSMHSYGAQFCELRVHASTGELRIDRWLGSFDAGTILNAKTATSQFRGGIIMGIGMALTEETLFDERYGRIVNASLAEYHLPVHLDVPEIEIIYNDIPDERSPLGARGIGEIGITGAAAAIANAVFNATGKRVRDLPITLDKLL